MLVSYNWIKEYIDLPNSVAPEELALQLTMSTVEIEEIKDQGKLLDGVVVGEILEIKKHPGADKLSVAKIDVGEKKPRQVIFGQMVDMEVGFKVPVALAPTVLPSGDKIKKAKLRGETSEGMLCLDQELGLLDEGTSIRFFDKKVKNGTKITKALGLDDVVFDIDNKSMTHRPDLWGHYGMAREVAALHHKKLAEYSPPAIKTKKGLKINVRVEDSKLCPRYMAAAVGGVKIEPSPEWMQKRLMAIGLRPINNIVDITNYVLLDLGQPLHAFDSRQILDKEGGIDIVVRKAEEKEKFVTLDEQEHDLDTNMLVIADKQKAVALAGVMGGLNSEIQEDTTEVVFESANFDATNIRRTSTKLGLRTDSSARFEKSLDPNNAELALRRAVQLTLELCPGSKVISNVADVSDFKLDQGPIELSLEFLEKKMGIEVEVKRVVKILEGLGFSVKHKKGGLLVSVPTWRATKDISIPEDLVEEVARIYGYDNIEVSLPEFVITPPERNELRLLERKIKELLSKEHSFTEVYNYSFVSPGLLDKLGMKTEGCVELDNPIAKDRPYLRESLIPNLLENIEKNLHYSDTLKLFEVGKRFVKGLSGQRASENSDELLPGQDLVLAMAYAGKGDKVPFHEVAHTVQEMVKELGCTSVLEPKGEVVDNFVHPARQAQVMVKGEVVGGIMELHPSVQKRLGIEERVALVEINLSQLVEYSSEKIEYHTIPQYPAVERDIAFVVDSRVVHGKIVEAIKKTDSLVEKVELFDVFEDDKIGRGRKSLAYHITYRSSEKTLESKEMEKVHDRVVKKLERDFKAEVRK